MRQRSRKKTKLKLFCSAVNGAGSGHQTFGVWSPAPPEDFGRGGDNLLAGGSDSGERQLNLGRIRGAFLSFH
ncbi:hypothetical protein Dsin_002170 [Dipteronia sinensis]|uniref:Uncharacterized protein n=1 Tax=Dipteronia sinensis TaxID=43782 RepID=A0AAE0EJF4_9ROSI|nr:hypothetical protein Dsin_002170 [Dipteronia sinensis]